MPHLNKDSQGIPHYFFKLFKKHELGRPVFA